MDGAVLVAASEVDVVELGVVSVLVEAEGAVDVELPGEEVDSHQGVVDLVARGEHRGDVEHPGVGEATKYRAALPMASSFLLPASLHISVGKPFLPFRPLYSSFPFSPFLSSNWQSITDSFGIERQQAGCIDLFAWPALSSRSDSLSRPSLSSPSSLPHPWPCPPRLHYHHQHH